MIELIAVHEPETKMIPNYNNRMIGTYERRSKLDKLVQAIPVIPPPEKPSLIRRILKWIKK